MACLNTAGDSGVPVNKVSQLLPQSDSTDSITHTLHTSHTSASSFPSQVTSSLPEVHMVKSGEETGLSDMQKTFHVLLNPEIPELCEILQLSVCISCFFYLVLFILSLSPLNALFSFSPLLPLCFYFCGSFAIMEI